MTCACYNIAFDINENESFICRNSTWNHDHVRHFMLLKHGILSYWKKIVININNTNFSGNNDWSHHMTRVTPSLASHLHIAWFPAAMASWRVDELENTSSSRTSNDLNVYKPE